MRIAMGVEYDGTAFRGWQSQANASSVQEEVERAVSAVADHPVIVHCAGRTDAGVHGTGQVIHFDTHANRTTRSWILGSNVNLSDSVNVCWAKEVPEAFHARFSALSRSYRYLIINRWARSSLWRDRAVWVHRPLDAERMHAAGSHLIGEHDFSSYRALGCQARSPVRRITHLAVTRREDQVILDVTANGFLHHMVRNIAGVLIAIGRGDRPADWSREVLEHRDRTLGGVTAPPQGLYLTRVEYPPHFEIPDEQWGDEGRS